MYDNGEGVAQNYEEAVKWYKKVGYPLCARSGIYFTKLMNSFDIYFFSKCFRS